MFWVWATLVAPPVTVSDASPRAPMELVAVVHDPTSGVSAGLRLTSDDRVRAWDVRVDESAIWAVVTTTPNRSRIVSTSLGVVEGDERPRAALLGHIEQADLARGQVMGWVGASGSAVFRGAEAAAAVVDRGPHVIVMGVGLPRAMIHQVYAMLQSISRDPVDALLDVAGTAEALWPTSRSPRSLAMLGVGPACAREEISVEGKDAVARRLVEQHLWHLATVEVGFQLEAARRDCPDHHLACVAATRALTEAATRALLRFPDDPRLLEQLAEGNELRVASDRSYGYSGD